LPKETVVQAVDIGGEESHAETIKMNISQIPPLPPLAMLLFLPVLL
jgi:hypothetical protein